MKKRGLAVICLLLAAALLAGGCGGGSAPPAETKKEIVIGGIIDLTGPTGDVGSPFHDGAQAYFKYLNGKGGLDGHPVRLEAIDYAYEIKRAQEAYNKLVKSTGVPAILGWGTGDTDALKGFVAKDEILYLSGSYSEYLTDIEACPYNFVLAASYSDQARIALKWAKDNWPEARAPKLSFVYNNTPFGTSHLEDAKSFAQELGFELVGDEVLDLRTLDATTQMLNLKNNGADFAIIQGTSNLAATVLKDARKLEVPTQFIGLNWAFDEKIVQLAGVAANGYIGVVPFAFPGEDVAGMADIKAYLESKGKGFGDVNQKFVQGWMSAMVMLEGVRLSGGDFTGSGIRKGLESLSGFDPAGLGAPVTFTSESHRGSVHARLAQVQDGGMVYLTDWISYK
jgi:branched-chain amino acid transport system substrate-binding protein